MKRSVVPCLLVAGWFSLLGILLAPRSAHADCSNCDFSPLSGIVHTIAICKPVPPDGTVGATVCTLSYAILGGIDCVESGDACSVVNAGGGGGGAGGGGGGGGGTCRPGHFCPAECFSCPPLI